MKILIAYVNAGAGHRKAAEAIFAVFKARQPEWDVRLVDALQYAHPFFRCAYLRGYYFLVNHAQVLWAAGFWFAQLKAFRRINKKYNLLLDRVFAKSFLELLKQEDPDCLISTHFFPSEMTAYLKKKGVIRSKLVTVVTDFGVHQFWLDIQTDIYISASGYTTQHLLEQKTEGEIIRELGIPVDARFTRQYDRRQLAAGLGIDPEKFTVLLITGSFGIGPLEQISEALHNDAQVLVVCARNDKLYQQLAGRNLSQVKVFGFVDNVHELMAVSDMIITKPGGMTIAEVLASGLVPIFISPIPGQEVFNVLAFESYGIGERLKDVELIRKAVRAFMDDPQLLNTVRGRVAAVRKPHAAEEIYRVVCESCAGLSG